MPRAIGPAHRRAPWLADMPSVLFLLGVVANTALIVGMEHTGSRVLLALVQALLLKGCQEAKHQCVHRTFLRSRRANDMVGTLCAALVGVNFVAYRYFHFQHHRAPCTDDDPEGRLYALSWRTRWIWLLAPLEVPWVAFHINRVAWPMVPVRHHKWRAAAAACGLAFGALLGLLAWRFPQEVLWAYAVPLLLFSWADFPLTQSEHYGAEVLPAACHHDPGAMTNDVVLPAGLGWLTLHGSLHRVHHRQPYSPWHEAPTRLRADASAAPIPYALFVRRWMAEGPRRWTR
jgi:fatty acid desaturase